MARRDEIADLVSRLGGPGRTTLYQGTAQRVGEWTARDLADLLSEGGNLLSRMETNAKTVKQLAERRFEGRILYLAPAYTVSPFIGRRMNLCPNASGCVDACLNTAGRAQIRTDASPLDLADHPVHRARIRRAALWATDKNAFLERLNQELINLERLADRSRRLPVARLDGTSDIGLAERVAADHPRIQFYDYTKRPGQMRRYLADKTPPNTYWVFSLSATNHLVAMEVLDRGGTVAVVFNGSRLPRRWKGLPVIDGDRHDFRFTDRPGPAWVGLRAKGRAKNDDGNFTQRRDN